MKLYELIKDISYNTSILLLVTSISVLVILIIIQRIIFLKLKDGKIELENGKSQLSRGWDIYNTETTNDGFLGIRGKFRDTFYQQEMNAGWDKLQRGERKYSKGLKKYNAGKTTFFLLSIFTLITVFIISFMIKKILF